MSDAAANDDNEVFNKNAVKRLVTLAGIARMSKEIPDVVNEIATEWTDAVLTKAMVLLAHANHKTFNVSDLDFLSQHYPSLIPSFIAPDKVSLRSCKKDSELGKVLRGKLQGVVLTAPRTFDAFVRARFLALQHTHADALKLQLSINDKGKQKGNFRIGSNEQSNNTVSLLQLLCEEHIIQSLLSARRNMGDRDTIMGQDMGVKAIAVTA